MNRLPARRALEALRAGVPNRDVARLLTPAQPRALEAFDTLLKATTERAPEGVQPPGLLVSGGFGTGKSHLLEFFENAALDEGFICSRVVLSKETPLCDPLKVFRACIASAVAPDRKGPALFEIAADFPAERPPAYHDLYHWAHRETELDPRFPATLFLFEREGGRDEELRDKLLAEWMGFPMKVGELRAALKAQGESAYAVARPLKDQTHRRFEFLSRFFRAAGYSGWVILLDETELVSKYSLRQRGKSYAQLARLLGQVKGVAVPGLASVFTITDDYAGEVLRRRNDIVKVPARMRQAEDPFVAEAEIGMNLIERRAVPLLSPTREQVRETREQVARLYEAAYGWEPPPAEDENSEGIEYAGSTRMRQYVRTWINTWDLRRLYGYHARTEAEALTISYEEDRDLQESAEREAPLEDNGPVPDFGPDA